MEKLPRPPQHDQSDLQKAIRRYTYNGKVPGTDITAAELQGIIRLYDRYDADRGTPSAPLKGGLLPQTLREAIYEHMTQHRKDGVLTRSENQFAKGSISVRSAASILRRSLITFFPDPCSSLWRFSRTISFQFVTDATMRNSLVSQRKAIVHSSTPITICCPMLTSCK